MTDNRMKEFIKEHGIPVSREKIPLTQSLEFTRDNPAMSDWFRFFGGSYGDPRKILKVGSHFMYSKFRDGKRFPHDRQHPEDWNRYTIDEFKACFTPFVEFELAKDSYEENPEVVFVVTKIKE